MKKCVFFDRDGIVNRSPGPGYVERWEDFKLLPDFVEVLRIVASRGYESVIVTNQRGVARGIMTEQTVNEMHDKLRAVLLEDYDLELLDIFCCMHNRDECECRKPKPGMLIQASKKHNIDLKLSWMIGDNETDIEAGRAAGCKTILVSEKLNEPPPDHRVGDMKELKSLVEALL
jgi:D-glycero-D-manno-heptose 1,7-bisphosphate phosphatase